MSTIVENNRAAIQAIAWLTLPSGIALIIGLSSLLESIGIAVFYSGLFVSKAQVYAGKIGFGSWATELSAVFSLLLGFTLAVLNSIGVMVLRLIGEVRWSRVFALVFMGLAIFSYYNTIKMDTATGFNYGLFLGVFFMILVPSVLINVLSAYLANQIISTVWFKEMTDQIFDRASGRKGSALSELIVNRSGKLQNVN